MLAQPGAYFAGRACSNGRLANGRDDLDAAFAGVLLRQYFPKGTDLSFHGPGILDNVAAELNARPRKRFN
jgi:hypothetical protein